MPAMIAKDNLAVVILLCGEIWNSTESLHRATLKGKLHFIMLQFVMDPCDCSVTVWPWCIYC